MITVPRPFTLLVALAIAPIMVFAQTTKCETGDKGGHILPGPASPRGYSLSDMARVSAFFNTGPRELRFYPETPFQILYAPVNASPI